MSVYKATLMWNQSIMGVSETWYSPDVSSSKIGQTLQAMLAARFALLGPNQFAVGVRLALYGAKRQSTVLLPPATTIPGDTSVTIIPVSGTYKYAASSPGTDQLRGVLQYKLGYGDTRSVLRYMSGIPDAVSFTEPATINYGAEIRWFQALKRYFDLLISAGWQIRARAVTGPNAPASVTGVTSQAAAPSLLGIVLPAATAPPIVQGSQVSLQHFRPAKFTRNATVNGTWTVDSVNATLTPGSLIVYLRNSSTIDPQTVRLTALSTIQLIGYSLFPVQAIDPFRVGIHKRGRPSMAPRGRRSARPTLDP
jgi:hypothetical protein